MVDIYPFKGIRYNLDKTNNDMSLVATEPYDKISPDAQNKYYEQSPYNIVRVILGKDEPGDTESSNKYTRAAGYFSQWKQENILIQEQEASVYLYEQIYSFEGSETKSRKAFISMVKIEESPDVIRPHENTLSGPKADRLKLLQATGANLEQIFVLYSDENNTLQNKLQTEYKTPALFSYKDDFEVIHKFWQITDTDLISYVQKEMKNKDLFIADGHHRYETYINYKREQKAKHPEANEQQAFNFCMMTFIAMEDPGLTILPTHRLIKNLEKFDKDDFLAEISNNFSITKYMDEAKFVTDIKANKHSFGLIINGEENLFLITLKSEALIDKYIDPALKSKSLDVSILHTLILDTILGIDKDKLAQQTNVFYKRSAQGTIREVKNNNYQLGFIINSTEINEVKEVARAGERMPQKSTDFFPKIASGLVIANISAGEVV
ncbi:MAG: DUF1015 domain-containing protein [Candidatus Margulisiibacteriota bacterium]|nr:MAG: hypothetical protein A2X43_01140 [Candidatus Margulisbacteria bacterium GWD2_39_127]OGI03325.1 MAG: hypothetical protein A2X42_06925 [Candidatus Margulisbacteria bacterium GWF2_38_17]OGI12009.1 MAG: hypothetical protein A2X41_03005 [Candidatus Margulisbacteria bacterium GWE2_39_32]PZM77044.1 MAG: DUF1015 domain-containing protein [Candidatus Margulisiibacteriota bacterium]HAR63177.1 DUF1015 domain-containing protein [Candidatus Margulisiibacteriota bacterium]